jgi:hypothetical protein
MNRSHVSIAIAIVLLFVIPPAATAQTNSHWIGGTGNWSTTTNWDTNPNYPNNGTPTGTTYNAIIDGLNGNTSYTVTLNTDVTFTSLTLRSSRLLLTHQQAGSRHVNGSHIR